MSGRQIRTSDGFLRVEYIEVLKAELVRTIFKFAGIGIAFGGLLAALMNLCR